MLLSQDVARSASNKQVKLTAIMWKQSRHVITGIAVLNCVRLLTRILPYIFEDPDWRGFFWSTLPGQAAEEANQVRQNQELRTT